MSGNRLPQVFASWFDKFPTDRLDIVYAALPLVGALLIGAMLIAYVKRWRDRDQPERLSAGDQMSHFRSLYERGELSKEEFDRIRAMLGERLKKEMDVAPEEGKKDEPQT